MKADTARLALAVSLNWIRSSWLIRFRRPSSYLEKLLAPPAGAKTAGQCHSLNPEDWRMVRKVIRLTLRLTPLILKRHRCLLQSMIALYVLRSRDIPCRLHLGVHKDMNTARAHAWLEVEDRNVIGGHSGEYKEVIRTR